MACVLGRESRHPHPRRKKEKKKEKKGRESFPRMTPDAFLIPIAG